MKKIIILSLAFSAIICGNVYAQSEQDVKAIKSMCGCYEVGFNFTETFQYVKDSTYKPSPTKHEQALEWVQLLDDQLGKISLQHLLIVNDEMVIKHWRQDWLYQNTDLYTYNGFNDWNFVKLPTDKVKGQWTQKVYQVDDSPRYEGSATWVHVDGRHFWQNTTPAPLPRREHTIRKDYNILQRTNVYEIIAKGWIHNQDNDKLIKSTQGDTKLIAQEKGFDTYTKVADSRCAAAQNWWAKNEKLWVKVRAKWNKELAKNKYIRMEDKVDGKPLYGYLFKLSPDASQEEVDKVIDSFRVQK